jgi:hypothetical protein
LNFQAGSTKSLCLSYPDLCFEIFEVSTNPHTLLGPAPNSRTPASPLLPNGGACVVSCDDGGVPPVVAVLGAGRGVMVTDPPRAPTNSRPSDS